MAEIKVLMVMTDDVNEPTLREFLRLGCYKFSTAYLQTETEAPVAKLDPEEGMTPEQKKDHLIEGMGLIRDKADNYLAAATLKVSADIHIEGLLHGFKEIGELAQETHRIFS